MVNKLHSVKISLHPKQSDAFESTKKITVVSAGIQSGKTTVGALRFIRALAEGKAGDTYLLVAPTYKILNQSTLPTFLKYFGEYGHFKKVDAEFHCHHGPLVYIRTGTDPDSIEGIQDIRAVWADEAGKLSYRFWVNLEGRAARTDAPITLTTTPYALNWLFNEVIKPYQKGERDDVGFFQWTSKENPSFPDEHYERQRLILDTVTFEMKYGGEHRRRVGLVYELNDGMIIDKFDSPVDTKYFMGIDWGFTNPTAIVIRAVTPEGRHYQVSEFYESGVRHEDLMHLIKQKAETFKVLMIIADPEDPGKIRDIAAMRLPVKAADNNIKSGIAAHSALIHEGRYKIVSSCKHTIEEYETYSYPEKLDDRDPKEVPVPRFNHAMDANRYVSLYLKSIGLHSDLRPRIHREGNKPLMFSPAVHVPAFMSKEKKRPGHADGL